MPTRDQDHVASFVNIFGHHESATLIASGGGGRGGRSASLWCGWLGTNVEQGTKNPGWNPACHPTASDMADGGAQKWSHWSRTGELTMGDPR